MMLTEGQMNDHKGAALLLPVLPPASAPLGDRGYDSDGFREGLRERGIEPCIAPIRNRKAPLAYDKMLYRQRHRIENAFGRLKDWRRIATRYGRCAQAFFSAISIAATITVWLPQCVLNLAQICPIRGGG